MLLQRKPLSLATIGDIRARSQRLLLCAIPARSVINSSAAWERSVRGQKDACTPGLMFGDKSWRSHSSLKRGWTVAS